MKKSAVLASFVSSLFLLSCAAIGSEEASGDMVSVWSVDTSGKPPFKRTRIQVPAADLARLEVEAGVLETERVRVVDFRGKPPFRRTVKEIPVIDAASIEVEETRDRTVRPRPFLKRHR